MKHRDFRRSPECLSTFEAFQEYVKSGSAVGHYLRTGQPIDCVAAYMVHALGERSHIETVMFDSDLKYKMSYWLQDELEKHNKTLANLKGKIKDYANLPGVEVCDLCEHGHIRVVSNDLDEVLNFQPDKYVNKPIGIYVDVYRTSVADSGTVFKTKLYLASMGIRVGKFSPVNSHLIFTDPFAAQDYMDWAIQNTDSPEDGLWFHTF